MISRLGSVFCSTCLLITHLVYLGYQQRFDRHSEVNINVESLPMTLGEWTGENSSALERWSQDILKLDHYIRRVYKNRNGDMVLVYVGYWTKQSGEHQAAKHSPAVCLPSNGWSITPLSRETLKHGDSEITMNRLVGEINRRQLLFHYWFFSGEKHYWEEWQALLNISLETFIHGRSDGGIVEISSPIDRGRPQSIEEANARTQAFLQVFQPELQRLILEGAKRN